MTGRVPRLSTGTTSAQMSAVGYIVAAGVVLPALPFVLGAYAWVELTGEASTDVPEPAVEHTA